MTTQDRDADFAAFFQMESDRLQRFATFMTGDSDMAADLAQEALARTYRAWPRIHSGDPAGYARRVIVNTFRDKLRRDRLRRLRPLGALPHSTPSKESVSLERLRMTELLKTLTPLRRAVVILRFYEDMTEHQIADALDRPVGTVKSDLHRALKTLRALVVKEAQGVGGTHGH